MMKTWNAPKMVELNVAETANGIFGSEFEFCIWLNDSKKKDDETNEES